MEKTASQYFEENHFVKVNNFISTEQASFLYDYVKLSTHRCAHLENTQMTFDEDVYGCFNDSQAPGDYSKYGDLVFDTLLARKLPEMEILTGKKLIPTYSYYRLYTTNTELKRHKDRASCEISTTICIGYNADYNWPMFVGPKDGEKGTEGNPIHLEPGDMIIYRGYDIEHWREPFKGINHAQLFMHYNRTDGPFEYNEETDKFDGRPILGLTPSHRNQFSKELKIKKNTVALKPTSKIIE